MEYFRLMGVHALSATACSTSFVVNQATAEADADACLLEAGITFPLIAKPDLGWCGFGVCRLISQIDLANYLRSFPEGERLVLQSYVPYEREAGIFYVRRPGDCGGRLTGLALRFFPRVTGDGKNNLATLISKDSRLRRLSNDGHHRSDYDPDFVPKSGQLVRLATIGSTRVGGLYRNGSRLISPLLTSAIDAIARDMHEFHYGRFDVRFSSDEALMSGEGFTIIEVNGAGSEAIEAWDPDLSLSQAFGTLFKKQSMLFEIAAANRRRGFRPIELRRLARLHINQQKLISRYPKSN